MTRCVATNAAGARCMYRGDHGNDWHVYADDPVADSWRYGRLSAAVNDFINGRSEADVLARVFAEIEAAKP